MDFTAHIIKQQGRRPTESFEPHKLHASVRAACLCVETPEGYAEAAASSVCETVTKWLSSRPEVTSEDLRRKAADALAILQPDAAYIYKHHHSVI